MQVLALGLFWVTMTVALLVARLLLSLTGLVPAFRSTSEALSSAVGRSWLGAFVLQILSLVVFVPLLLATWTIQGAVERLGGGQETARSIALPVGLLALATPPLATILGAVQGFRAGWHEATGHEPEIVESSTTVGRFISRAGLDWVLRW